MSEKESITTLLTLLDSRQARLAAACKEIADWVDHQGGHPTALRIRDRLNDIEKDKMTLKSIQKRFEEMHTEYYNYEWTWAQEKLEEYWKKPIAAVTKEEINSFIRLWRDSVVELDNLIYDDAKKEFNLISMIGFGVDGDDEQKHKDFENVRGSFEMNPFVKEVLNHIERKTELGNKTIEFVENLV